MRDPERIVCGEISADVLASIAGRELLTNHLGSWPTFHNFEVVSITLDRAPWCTTATCDLRATFYVFDVDKRHEDPEYKQAFAEILFKDIADLCLDGFNPQNPITGLSITSNPPESTGRRFSVEWGGTCMRHEVSFSCDHISVIRLVDLNPFRKSLVDS